jgi:hypothetical protein
VKRGRVEREKWGSGNERGGEEREKRGSEKRL